MQQRVPLAIVTALTELYAEADVPPPTAERCIVPLGELVGSYNLTCTELPELTSETATTFLAQQGSILVPPDNVDSEKLAGFLYATARHGSIFVKRGDRVTRRRFSVAHELGHYLLHFRPYLTALRVDDKTHPVGAMDTLPLGEEETEPHELPGGHLMVTRPAELVAFTLSYEQMEREANQFAGELLMPSDAVTELVNRYSPEFRGSDLIWRLASDMLVSRAAMRWRLRDLGLLTTLDDKLN